MGTITFTDKEQDMLCEVLYDYCDMMDRKYKTSKLLKYQLNDGLGSALYKLYRGCNGEKLYEKYYKGEE